MRLTLFMKMRLVISSHWTNLCLQSSIQGIPNPSNPKWWTHGWLSFVDGTKYCSTSAFAILLQKWGPTTLHRGLWLWWRIYFVVGSGCIYCHISKRCSCFTECLQFNWRQTPTATWHTSSGLQTTGLPGANPWGVRIYLFFQREYGGPWLSSFQ